MKDTTKRMICDRDSKLKSTCKSIHHPLYTVTAILCDSVLYVISTKYDKPFCQSLFNAPLSVSNDLPCRNSIDDKHSLNTLHNKTPKLDVLLNQDTLVDASWHRTSLCLAVITTRKLYIFSSNVVEEENFR
jgi:hypothetical protein